MIFPRFHLPVRNIFCCLSELPFLAALACCELFSSAAGAADFAGDVPVVRVGYFKSAGYHEIVNGGEGRGYGFDFYNLLQRYANLRVEYVGYDKTWPEMQAMLERGEIDVLGPVNITPEREKLFAFSRNIGTSHSRLTARINDNRWTAPDTDWSVLNGIKVGMIRGSGRIERFAEFAREKQFTYTTQTFGTEAEMLDALARDDVDAVTGSSHRRLQNEKVLATFAPTDMSVMVRKDDEALLKEIDYAIAQMDINEGDWRRQLYYANFLRTQTQALTFSDRELAFIRDVRAGRTEIRVTAEPFSDPFVILEDGRLSGIVPDYFEHLMRSLDLPYTLFVAKNYQQKDFWMQSHVVDVVMSAPDTVARQLNHDAGLLTDPYMRLTVSRVTRRDFKGAIRRVAVIHSQGLNGIEDPELKKPEIVTVSNRLAALEAVRDGKADAAYVYTYIAEHFVNQDNENRLIYSILNAPIFQVSIAVNPETNHALLSILNKAIRADNSHELDQLVLKYTRYEAPAMTVVAFLKSRPWFTSVLLLFILMLGATICFKTQINRSTKKIADERLDYARQMQAKNEELRKVIRREEAANLAKRQFLFNMSHDIRTPMNAILGFAQIARAHLTDAKKLDDYLDKIQQSGNNLLGLINNVLEMSRIETGKAHVDPTPCNLAELLQSVSVSFEELARRKRLTFEHSQHLPHPQVFADATKIRQIFTNIISNAVKYTPEGGIVRCRAEETPATVPDAVNVTFTVEDTGIGISKEFLPHIFDQFERERSTTEGGIEGTGLGLAIAKQVVTLLGGTIAVASTLGRGSVFTVKLTFRRDKTASVAPAAADEGQLPIAAKLKDCRILLAEDNDLNAEIALEVLKQSGVAVRRARDGEECVRILSEAPAGTYDAVLMDIQMPKMDGCAATEAIRRLKDDAKRRIPVIALTANAFTEDEQKARDAGMDAFVAKPIDFEKLLAVLAKFTVRA